MGEDTRGKASLYQLFLTSSPSCQAGFLQQAAKPPAFIMLGKPQKREVKPAVVWQMAPVWLRPGYRGGIYNAGKHRYFFKGGLWKFQKRYCPYKWKHFRIDISLNFNVLGNQTSLYLDILTTKLHFNSVLLATKFTSCNFPKKMSFLTFSVTFKLPIVLFYEHEKQLFFWIWNLAM